MKVFLDTSVLLAACASPRGASRDLFHFAPIRAWELRASPYVFDEVFRNLPLVGRNADQGWEELRPRLAHVPDRWVSDRITVYDVRKDRPVLFSAFASCEVLLTWDRNDFQKLLGATYFELDILTPEQFILREKCVYPTSK